MLLDQVSETQLQAGRVLGGAAMAAFLAAPHVPPARPRRSDWLWRASISPVCLDFCSTIFSKK